MHTNEGNFTEKLSSFSIDTSQDISLGKNLNFYLRNIRKLKLESRLLWESELRA